jgi:hypothetical protein
MYNNWRPGGTVLGIECGLGWQLSEARMACVLPASIEDRPLLWMVVKLQIYYPEHILAYGSGKPYYSLVMGSSSFQTDY